MLEHRPLHQELRLGRGNRDILYMLDHRPLHQDVRRKYREGKSIGPSILYVLGHRPLHQDVRRKKPARLCLKSCSSLQW